MARTRQYLTQTNLPPRALLDHAKKVGKPDNFFVGLPDGKIPHPRNILLFCDDHLLGEPKEASHHRHMLILNLQTEASLLHDSHLLHLRPGQALLVLPFQSHRLLVQGKQPSTWLYITFECDASDLFEGIRNRPLNLPPSLWPFIESLIGEYQAAALESEPSDAVAALLCFLLARLLLQGRQNPVRWETRPPLPSHQLVQRACRLIGGRLNKPLMVQQIAAELAVSAGYLRACFQRVIGLRVSAYIRKARACSACALLSRTEMNITLIGEQCGFSSLYAFSRAFHREIGMPPTRYRSHLWEDHNVGKPVSRKRSRKRK